MAAPSISGFVIPGGVAARDFAQIQFDLSGGAAPYSNPFDDAVIAVDAAITDPNGVLRLPPAGSGFTIPCAFEQIPTITGHTSGHGETYSALPAGHWYLNFRFDMPGVWTFRITATDAGGTFTTGVQSITIGAVGAGTAAVHGGHLSPWRVANGLYLEFDDGTWLPPIGTNVGVEDRDYTLDGTPGFTKLMGYIGANGGTVGRFMMSAYHRNGLEWSSSGAIYQGWDNLYGGLSKFSQQHAFRIDEALRVAQASGISLLVCINTHGEFSTSSDPRWTDSPYNSALGGPIPSSDPALLLTNAGAMKAQKLKLRYIVARFAGRPSFGAIEWMNEGGTVGNGFFVGNNTIANHAAFVAALQAYLRTIDPFALVDSWSEEWDPSLGSELTHGQHTDPIMDVVALPQAHVYQNDPMTTINDRRHTALDMIRNMQVRFGLAKPCLWFETGDYRTPSAPEPNFDPTVAGKTQIQKDHLLAGTHVRASAWEAVVGGFIGGLEWWSGSGLAEDASRNRVSGTLPYGGAALDTWTFPLQTAYQAVAAALAGEDPTSWPSVGGPLTVTVGSGLAARAWGYSARAYVYAEDAANNYGASDVGNLVGRSFAAGPVTVNGLADGPYNAEVWSTRGAGGKTATIACASAGGVLTFTAPLLDRDAFYKIVSTAVAGPVVVVYDSGVRTVAAGSLGSADTGGAWTIGGTAADFAVNGGQLVLVGSVSGATRRGWLGSTSWREQDIHVKVQTDKVPTGASQQCYLMARAQDLESNYYRATVAFKADLSIAIQIDSIVAGVSTVIGAAVTPGRDTFTVGTEFWIRLVATGLAPTQLKAKVWKVGTTEPVGWDVTCSDSSAPLQGVGATGIRFYVGAASNTPVTSRWDELQGSDTSSAGSTPTTNAPAGLAAGSGAAQPVTTPTTRLAPAGLATGSGLALQTAFTRAVAGTASGIGTARPPSSGIVSGVAHVQAGTRAVAVGNPAGALAAPESYPLAAFDSLTLTEQFWGGDSFVMTIGAAATGAGSLLIGTLLWLPDEGNAVYLVEQVETDKTGASRADAQLVISGRSLDGFAGQERVVTPDPGVDYDSQHGASAETAMKHYVRNHASTGAAAPRQIAGLVVAPDLARGLPVDIDARYQTVDDVVLQLGLLAGLGWQATIDPVTGLISWDVINPTDRSASVFLDFAFETVSAWTDVESALQSSTVAIVAGQGDLANRDIEVRYQGAEPTGLARREVFLDARDVAPGDLATLDARGDAYLAAAAPTRSIAATIYPAGSFQPGRDWFLGDIVLLHDLAAGVNESARVVKLVKTFTDSAAAPVVVASVGKPFPGSPSSIAAPSGGALDTVITTIGDVNTAVGAAIGGLSAGGANLVHNSSFESAAAGSWTVGPNWTCPYTSGGIIGSASARVQLAGQVAGDLVSTSFISVNPTADYWISFWSYLSAWSVGTARFSVREFDVNGVLLATTNVDLTAVEPAPVRHALHFGIDATTPGRLAWRAATASIKVAFLTADPATLTWQVDGVQVERGNIMTAYAPAPQELIDGQIGSTQIADNAVTTQKVIAGAIVAGKLAAGAVTADKLAATLILGSLIKTADSGMRIELDAAGLRAIDAAGNLLVNVPTDGRPVKVTGELDALSLVVSGSALLQGLGNELSQGAVMTLASFQSNPSQAPSLAQSLDGVAFDPALEADSGLAYSATGGAGGATKVFYVLGIDFSTGSRVLRLTEMSVTTRAELRHLDFPPGPVGGFPVTLYFSVAALGTKVYVLATWFDANGDGRANTYVCQVSAASMAILTPAIPWGQPLVSKNAQQHMTFGIGGAGAGKGFSLEYFGQDGASRGQTPLFIFASNLTAPAIQAALRTLTGDSGLTVTGPTNTGPFVIQFASGLAEHDLVAHWNTTNHSGPDIESFAFGGWSTPVIASDGTSLFVADIDNTNSSNPALYWRSYSSSLVFASQVTTTYHPGWTVPLLGAAAGSFDVGAARLAVAFGGDPASFPVSGKVEHFDLTTGAIQPNEEWLLRSTGGSSGGIAYGDALGDGARFWSWSDADLFTSTVLAKHSTWIWTSASPVYWVAYSWWDSAGTTHESQVGPRASITMLRRRQLTVTTLPLPGSGGADDPNNVRVYMAPNATDPGIGALHLQATSAIPTALLTGYAAGGASDPGANGFISTGVPAKLGSASAGWTLKGDGSINKGSTSFPTTPADGDHFVRSDLDLEFYWDAASSHWLSSKLFIQDLPMIGGSQPLVNSNDVIWRLGHPGAFLGLDVWLTGLEINWLVSGGTALSGSNEWVGSFQKITPANATAGIATITIASGALSTWTKNVQSLGGGTLVDHTAHYSLILGWTKTGTPGTLLVLPTLSYRLVGV